MRTNKITKILMGAVFKLLNNHAMFKETKQRRLWKFLTLKQIVDMVDHAYRSGNWDMMIVKSSMTDWTA